MGDPLPDGVDLRPVFASPTLQGLYGLKPVLTTQSHLCGAAAVCTILGHLGKPMSVATATNILKPSPVTGVDWKSIWKITRSNRLYCIASKESPAVFIRDMAIQRKHLLLDWGDWPGHWLLACGFDANSDVVVFLDCCKNSRPFVGVPWSAFTQHWDGITNKCPRLSLYIRLPYPGHAFKFDRPRPHDALHWSHTYKSKTPIKK